MLRSTISRFLQPDRLQKLAGGKAGRRLRPAVAILLVAAAVNALVFGIAVAPAVRRMHAEQEKLAELRRRFADALLFQKQKQALAGLNEGILTQKDVPLLLKDLVQMARRRGLSSGTINSDMPTPSSGGLTLLAFTVPLSGNYANGKRYIHDLETSDLLVGIQDARFSKEKQTVKLDLKLITYIRGE
jgi:Tfp pilus assembly protein PilO